MESHRRKGPLLHESGPGRLGVKSHTVITALSSGQVTYLKPCHVPQKAVSPRVWYWPRDERWEFNPCECACVRCASQRAGSCEIQGPSQRPLTALWLQKLPSSVRDIRILKGVN